MPARYELAPESGLIRLTYSGAVTSREVIELYDRLAAEEEIGEDWACLVDTSGVTAASFSLEDLKHVVDTLKRNRLALRPSAIVAEKDLVFGIARMYEALVEFAGGQVAVFRTLTQAESWLAALSARSTDSRD